MKYQKEFEEYFFSNMKHTKPLKVTESGKYFNWDVEEQYHAFVAGIESGIKKKEPTLLELVGEWRKSNISDEDLLNKICEEVKEKKINLIISGEVFHIKENTDYIKHRLVDLKYQNGNILERRVSAHVNWDNNNLIAWRPSAVQD